MLVNNAIYSPEPRPWKSKDCDSSCIFNVNIRTTSKNTLWVIFSKSLLKRKDNVDVSSVMYRRGKER